MKRQAKKLQLSKESLSRLDLHQAVVGANTAAETDCFACNTIGRTACLTNCVKCGNTYITCLTCDSGTTC